MFCIQHVDDNSDLRDKQRLFAWLFWLLQGRAYAMGYRVVAGEVFRGPAQVVAYAEDGSGVLNTLHALCLAGHLELFSPSGRYLEHTVDFRELGEWWKAQHPLCRWGGDFTTRSDGCHFSVAHDGMA